MKFPYQAWVLQPSFKPKEVTIVRRSWLTDSHHEEVSGKCHHLGQLHPSKAAAIQAGREQIEKQRVDLAKRQERLNKRIAALDKAEKEG